MCDKKRPDVHQVKIPIAFGIVLALIGQSLPTNGLAAGCEGLITKTYLGGKIDEYLLPTDPADTTGYSLSYPLTDFDSTVIDRHMVHRFSNLAMAGYSIADARFEFKAKPLATTGPHSSGNDTIRLQFDFTSAVYSAYFGSGNSGNDLSAVFGAGQWGTNNSTLTPMVAAGGMVFNNANLTNFGSVASALLSGLNTHGQIYFYVQDDTAVDYAQLTLDYCPLKKPPVLTDGGNHWMLTSHQDASPAHVELNRQDLCFKYVISSGTHQVYRWYSTVSPSWRGWARVEGDQVFMHGDYALANSRTPQHTALQWEVASEIGNQKQPSTKGYGHCVDWENNTTYGNTNMFANVRLERTGKTCPEAGEPPPANETYVCTPKREQIKIDIDPAPVEKEISSISSIK